MRFLVSGIFDRLLADLSETRIDHGVVLVGRLAAQHAARAELLAEIRKVLFRRVIVHLRLLFGIEVVEV